MWGISARYDYVTSIQNTLAVYRHRFSCFAGSDGLATFGMIGESYSITVTRYKNLSNHMSSMAIQKVKIEIRKENEANLYSKKDYFFTISLQFGLGFSGLFHEL